MNCSSARTTSAWSSACGSPDTVTEPITPAPSTAIGNEPPCAAYVSGSSRDDCSNVVPFARKRVPTRYELSPYRSTTLRLRSIQASLSALDPGSAAWNIC